MDKSFDSAQDKFKVSLYIRVSTGRQASEGDSLDEQEKELKKFCDYKGYLLHKIHIERGRSAKNTNRPEYQKLLADVKDKKINAVVVKKLDRLSRSLLDFEEFMKTAQINDIEFISLKENFDTTNAMGKAMLRVALVFAQLEREQTSERVLDVMAYRAEQGLRNGGTIPYGYDVLDKELIPHKQEKKIVELIFNKFIETKSTTLVAHALNSMGIKYRKALLWEAKRIHDILKKIIYTGKIKWNETVYAGVHQPLVSDAKFNQAQEIFSDRFLHIEKSKIGGALKGFLYCGLCEAPFAPNYTQKKTGAKYFYYRCINTRNSKSPKCKSPYLPLEAVEYEVFDEILALSHEEKLSELKNNIEYSNLSLEKEISAFNENLATLEKQLEIVKSKKEKYLDSLISKNFNPSERRRVNEKIEEFSLLEKQITAQIHRLQFDISSKTDALQSMDEFKKEIIYFGVNFESMSITDKFNWLRKNIERITYSEKEIKIQFKLLKIGS